VLAGGHLVDRHGPLKVVTAGGLLAGTGLATGAGAPTVLVLSVGLGALFGSGSGLTYSAAVTATSLRYGRHRGRAVGAVVAAYAAGPVVAGPVGAWGVEQAGWRPTLLVAAIGVAALVVLAGRGLSHRPAAPGTRVAPVSEERSGSSAALGWLWLLFLCTVAPALFAFAFAADIAAAAGVAPSAAGSVVALMAGGNLFGRLAAGPLSDRLGVQAALRVVVVAQLVALLGPGWSSDTLVVVTGLALLAVAYGAVSALLPLATVGLMAASFGVSYGRVFTSWGVAGVLGPVAGAALVGGTGGHASVFRAALAVAGLAVVALFGFERSLGHGRVR
jgi:OFA family oxalate/formate antiporter-like MFS transporter